MQTTAENISAFLTGQPINVVNGVRSVVDVPDV